LTRASSTLNTSPSTFHALRRFAAAAIAIAPRRSAETAIVTLVLSATEGIGLLLLVPLLQLVGVDAQQGALTRIVAAFAAAFHAIGLQPTLGSVLGVYVVIVGLQGVLVRRQAELSAVVQQEIVTTLRNRLYRAIAGAKWIYFSRTRSSDYTQMLTDGVGRVGTAAYFMIDLLVTTATSLVYVGLAFRVSPAMTVFVLICGAILALTMRGKMDRARAIGEALSESWTRLYAAISEHFGSLKIAKGYGAERRHTEAFERLSADLSAVGLASNRSYTRVQQQLSLGSAVVLAVIVYVSYTILAVSTAQLLLLLFLFARLVPRLTGIYSRVQTLATALPAFTALADAERSCLAAAEPVVAKKRAIALGRRIEYDQVTFDYRDDGQSPAVRRVNLTIDAGATTAIVGPSGAGKSTVADLLMGLLVPSEGRILVDGAPLDTDRLESWRDQIGYVAQESFLFHDSVRANLLWARPEAGEEELWRALRLASADEFVSALPQGLDTVVGDRGALVSGGERQRLSLARALLRRPALLILDEATSSLDSENEARIQRAIEKLHQQMTIVIITHRLSTIRRADLIHVLDRGRLVESGTWDDLRTRKAGRFREMCEAQGIEDPVDPADPVDDVGRVRASSDRKRFEVIGR
jgi:ATP-binding cassette subfamily C protein